MRIAFVTFEYPPFIVGGAGVYALHITEELAKLGHQVVVFTPRINNVEDTECLPTNNLQVWNVPISENIPFRALQFWINLPGEIKKAENEQKFDLIHTNGISYWFLKKRLSKAPHVLTVHHLVRDAVENTGLDLFSRIKDLSGENGFFIPLIEKRCLNSADKIIAVSNYTKNRILQTYNIPPNMVNVVYNGVDFDNSTFTKDELDKTQKELKLPSLPVILFVGRVDDPRKGLDVLIKAFRKVLEEVNATLLVVGKGDRTMSQDLAGSDLDKIVFTGFVDDITLKKCYKLCNVYVCPSRLEGFGLTLLEAFVAGKPIVATKAGAIPEIVRGNNTNNQYINDENTSHGFLVDVNDYNKMADAILNVLTNKELSKEMGLTNQKYVETKFNWNKSTDGTLNAYQSGYNEF